MTFADIEMKFFGLLLIRCDWSFLYILLSHDAVAKGLHFGLIFFVTEIAEF